MNRHINRHNLHPETYVRALSQGRPFPVIQSQRVTEVFCKMRFGRKGPVKTASFGYLVLIQSALLAGAASAADVQTTPRIELRAEQNDNFGLIPGGSPDSDVYGYIADAQALISIATPRGVTELRPRVKLQEFPDREDLQRVEGFFDLRSRYRWERSNFDIAGHLSRQDLYNAETPSGDFDPTDPGAGGGSDSGEIIVGETRDQLELRPTFEHRMTERTSISFGVEYVAARYDTDEGFETKTDYDFGMVSSYLTWAVSPTSDFSAGAYGSRYKTKDDSEQTDAVGGLLGYDHRWSETDGIEATLFYEQDDTTEFFPVPLEESESNWGGDLTGYRKKEVSEWRLSVGRAFLPTGDNGKAQLDQIRLQYERQLSQRLTFRGVGRVESRTGFGGTEGGINRDYARADLSLKWFVTQTWYVGGGYSYMWEDRETSAESGDNNKLFINFGYQGLSPSGR